MKIALVASSYLPRPDGFERHVNRLAAALVRRGAQVQVLTQDAGRRLPRILSVDGVIVRRFRLPLGAAHGAVAPGLWETLRRSGHVFDLAHIHTPHPSFAAAVMRVGPRRKVFTPHAPVKLLVRWPYMRVTRSVVEHALTLCTSVAESELLAERIPSTAARIAPVTAGVDAEAIRAAAPFEHPGRVVLALGPLERRRRIGRAIGAMASLDGPHRLVVEGGGPALLRLAAHAQDLRVASKVDFVGRLGDAELYRWLRTARVLVALADQGTSGVEVAEGLAAGTAVVASDIPVHREAAARAGNADVTFVSPEGSPLELADAISVAVGRRDLAPEPANVPSWDAVADAMLSIYEHEVSRGRSNGARPQPVPGSAELA
jgi:glycosyltransferase involved in cell wall biosynthesis